MQKPLAIQKCDQPTDGQGKFFSCVSATKKNFHIFASVYLPSKGQLINIECWDMSKRYPKMCQTHPDITFNKSVLSTDTVHCTMLAIGN